MAEHDVSGEARDDHGRWTVGSASAPSPAEARQLIGPGPSGNDAPTFYESKSGSPTYMLDDEPTNMNVAERTAFIATGIAEKLDYDVKNIIVTDRDRVFNLNGVQHNYAGSADLQSGRITLYTKRMEWTDKEGNRHPDEHTVAAVTAHEIMHQKFQAFLTEHRNELGRMQQDPNYSNLAKDFMMPNGLLKEPYAAQYPAYQEYTRLTANWDKMAKEDGVTAYSREWWDAAKGPGGVTFEQAYHETLAEMATLHEQYGRVQGPPAMKKNGMLTSKSQSKDWIALYKAVNRRWKESREAFRRAG